MKRASRSSMAPATHVHRELPLRNGKLRLVTVADTHGKPHRLAGAHIAALSPDVILHAGDIGDLTVLDELAKLAPVLAVRGNIDEKAPSLPDTMTLSFTDGGNTLFRFLLLHIAVAGPRLRGDAAALARKERAALVVCGHSHVPFIGRHGDLSVFNPGSVGPRRFQLPIVFGLIDIEGPRVRSIHHIDCETGQRWHP